MNKIATIFRGSNLARFLMPAGIMLIIFGIIILVINIKNQNYLETEAVVSKVELEQEAYIDSDNNRVEATYVVKVKYNVDGKQYEGEFSGLPEYKIGTKMKIYYNPSNPSQITQTKSLILPLALIIGGIAAFVGGIVSSIKVLKND